MPLSALYTGCFTDEAFSRSSKASFRPIAHDTHGIFGIMAAKAIAHLSIGDNLTSSKAILHHPWKCHRDFSLYGAIHPLPLILCDDDFRKIILHDSFHSTPLEH